MREVSCQCRVIGSVIALELSFIIASLPPSQREYRRRQWEKILHHFVPERSLEKLQTCAGVGEAQVPTLNISVIIKHSIKLQQLDFFKK